MKELTGRQVATISVLLLVGMKMLMLPSIIAQVASKDSLFSALVLIGIELLILVPIVFMLVKNPDTTLMQLLTKKFGSIVATVVMTLFILFFAAKLLYVMEEQYSFLIAKLYSRLHWLIYILPLFFLLLYFAVKGLKTLGRTCEIFFGFITVSIVGIIAIETFDLNWSANLPLFEDGLMPTINGALRSSFWCGNSLFLLLFMGKIKLEKTFKTRIFVYNAIAAVMFVVFVFIFTSLFGASSGYFKNAIADITIVTPYVSDLGTLDWIVLIFWNIALLLLSGTFITGLVSATQETYGFKQNLIPAIIIAVLAISLARLNEFNLSSVVNIVASNWHYAVLGVYGFFLIIMFLLFIIKRGKDDKKKTV